jgi:NitT/TauT family transport system substrate-binding protein
MIDRRTFVSNSLALAAITTASPTCAQATVAPLRVAAVKFGSLNWLLDTIKAEGIDQGLGLTLEAQELSNNQAGPIALLSGGADIVVSDWTWAMRQRGLGEALKFAPYSATLGAIMVSNDSKVQKLEDLEGKRLGVAGSSIDKSWLLLQAYAMLNLKFDIANKVTIQYGAAPLLTEQLRDGKLDGVLNFWTQTVRLSSLGFRPILQVSDVIKGLKVDPIPAFVGFVWKESTEATKGPQIAAFLKAASAGNAVLAKSDAAWERLKPATKATSPQELTALRAAYTSGIPGAWTPGDEASVKKIMDLLIAAGDTELVGAKTKFDPKLFHVASP